MAASAKTARILYQRSGNRCAFPKCGKLLSLPGTESDDAVVLSRVAHIVAQKLDGPRGRYPLPLEERDKLENLILLCEEHHTIVDNQVHTYTVERLRQMKEDHEQLMLQATGEAIAKANEADSAAYVEETLHSTLLPVLQMPRYVFGVKTDFKDTQEKEAAELVEIPKGEICPFIIRGAMLYCFQNLFCKGGPFSEIVGDGKPKRFRSCDWWDDPDQMAWFLSLLNRSLNKLTGRKGLYLDKVHRRFYFAPKEKGEPLEITYKPLNQSSTSRQVVWQPITKKTGLPKNFWYHLAVALKFHRVGDENWCLSLRPEMRVTRDGETSLDSEKIGGKVTRKKSRLYNYDLLGELQFWRDFLSGSRPRIVLSFGKGQKLVISTKMMRTDIKWPGMPEEHQKPFKNVEYEEDLFTSAELLLLEADSEEEDFEEEDEEWDDKDFEEEGLL